LDYAQKAVDLSQSAGEMSGEAWAWLYLGYAQLSLNQMEPARLSFKKSIEIREKLGQPVLSMEPIAGLVEVGMHTNDLDGALLETERILAHLSEGGTLNGTDEPLRVYYNCFQLLAKKQDPRSTQVLQAGIRLLDEQVSKFKDAHSRKRYVESVPWRLALRKAAKIVNH